MQYFCLVLFVILLPGTFGVLLEHFWSAFRILLPGTFVIPSPSTFVILLPGTFVVLSGHFWSAFAILLLGTFCNTFAWYFWSTFGALLECFLNTFAWYPFVVFSPSTFVKLLSGTYEYFCCTFGVFLEYFFLVLLLYFCQVFL